MKTMIPITTFVIGITLGLILKPKPSPPESNPNSGSQLGDFNDLSGKRFPFTEVIRKTCGVEMSVLDLKDSAHFAIFQAVEAAAEETREFMSHADSPARLKRRINEVSALFENHLRELLDAHPDFRCTIPESEAGRKKRSGYPDLRLKHLPSQTVAYLDPKLYEARSIDSSFRSFYFEPSGERTKVTENAIHLLLGFPHDGKTRQWTFGPPQLVDLSALQVKLKTEFSASNRELYPRK